MKTVISVRFIQYYGYFGYINQETIPTREIPNKINEIVLYDFIDSNREPCVITSFMLNFQEYGNLYFNMDLPLLNKIPTHRSPKAITRKEKFAFCTGTNSLWISVSAIELTGPIYEKLNYVKKRKNPIEIYGEINYSIQETYKWNGGQIKREIWYDYHQFLELKWTMEEKIKKLRWEHGDTLAQIEKAVKILLVSKNQAQSLMSIWRKGDVEELVMYMREEESKKKGGDK